MRSTVLALAFLALLIAAGEGRGEGNTVKLCGRDFVRAVVFTCGGSRWKRHLPDYHYLSEDNDDTDSSAYTEQRLETDSDEIRSEMGRDSRGARKTPVLNKREAARLLTASCCSIGCSKREISSLC